jgi:hypothetical protein
MDRWIDENELNGDIVNRKAYSYQAILLFVALRVFVRAVEGCHHNLGIHRVAIATAEMLPC